uniref:Chitinase-like protein PB1E7.04c-like n=1 Tax=Saccoglossus kowalevskii TaxID=10224 RepID=A0ABM0MVX0_SACKO|nr:PREDICTED: chitinase-like protein PB1E7.04c-like [Saccoglossus kowalevskii]
MAGGNQESIWDRIKHRTKYLVRICCQNTSAAFIAVAAVIIIFLLAAITVIAIVTTRAGTTGTSEANHSDTSTNFTTIFTTDAGSAFDMTTTIKSDGSSLAYTASVFATDMKIQYSSNIPTTLEQERNTELEETTLGMTTIKSDITTSDMPTTIQMAPTTVISTAEVLAEITTMGSATTEMGIPTYISTTPEPAISTTSSIVTDMGLPTAIATTLEPDMKTHGTVTTVQWTLPSVSTMGWATSSKPFTDMKLATDVSTQSMSTHIQTTATILTTSIQDRRYIDIGCTRYRVYNDTQSWESSKILCEKRGAVLASLSTSTVSDGVIQFIIDNNIDDGLVDYWIGLNDISQEGSYIWINGLLETSNGTMLHVLVARVTYVKDAISTHVSSTAMVSTTPDPDRRYIDIGCYRYSFHNDTHSWESSTTLCQQNGAVLASLSTRTVSDGVIQFIIDNNIDDGLVDYWIGLNDISQEGSYIWINGDPFVYTNWSRGNPNNFKNQDCGQLWTSRNFLWDDAKCSRDKGYICQRCHQYTIYTFARFIHRNDPNLTDPGMID